MSRDTELSCNSLEKKYGFETAVQIRRPYMMILPTKHQDNGFIVTMVRKQISRITGLPTAHIVAM